MASKQYLIKRVECPVELSKPKHILGGSPRIAVNTYLDGNFNHVTSNGISRADNQLQIGQAIVVRVERVL